MFEEIQVNGSIHEDPYNRHQLGDLSLFVDWETGITSIEEMDHGVTYDVHMGKASTYQLSGTIDIANFVANVYPRIIPELERLAEYYETYWDGHNERGRFKLGEVELSFLEGEIIDKCNDAPDICGDVCFSIHDCMATDSDILEFFAANDMDFMTADIDNMDIKDIKEVMAGDEGVWLCSDEEIREDLKDLRKDLEE